MLKFEVRKVDIRLAELCEVSIEAASRCLPDLIPTEGSIQHRDTLPANSSDGERVLSSRTASAYGAADIQLLAVIDLLIGLRDILRSSTSAVGVITLTRSCAEAASRALWLADSSITRHSRASRAVAELIYTAEQQRRIPGQTLSDQLTMQVKNATADANILGLQFQSLSKKQIADGQIALVAGKNARPTITRALSDLLDPIAPGFGVLSYSLWSAAAHASIHGLTSVLSSDGRMIRNPQANIATVASACAGATAALTNRIACAAFGIDRWRDYVAKSDAMWRSIFDDYRDLFGGQVFVL